MSVRTPPTDEHWMRLALAQARAAAVAGEVAVGAVVVRHGALVGQGHNMTLHHNDPSAHAEMVALRQAAEQLGNYRLPDCELFVTLEPCVMCAGAMLHARLKRVVFGAADPKTGAAGSVLNVFSNPLLNHQTQVQCGVLQQACADELQQFFSTQRQLQATHRTQSISLLRDDALRTPLRCFQHLPKLPGTSCLIQDLPALDGLRLHYQDTLVDKNTNVVVGLHGPRDWCVVWRQELAQALAQGQRLLCPDLIGFGQSDKPKKMSTHNLTWHASYLAQWMERLGLERVTLRVPAAMQALAHELQHVAGQRIQGIDLHEPAPVSEHERNAPFPDNGHRAALRAFSKLFS